MEIRGVQRRALIGLCLVAAWLVATPARALDSRRLITQYSHESWTGEDGLPQNTVFAVTQTRDGYVWLGTWEGLVRFDGARFTTYDRRNTPELRGQAVLALVEDGSGVLWLGTDRGLVAYEKGRFRRVRTEGEWAETQVRALALGEGALWVGTPLGVARVPLVGDGPWRYYTARDGLPGRGEVLSLLFDRGGTLWVGTNVGLARLAANQARLSGGQARAEALPGVGSVKVNALREARDGTLWVGSTGGLHALKEGRATRYTARDGLPNERVSALWEDRHGNLWVGLERGALTRRTRERFTSFGPGAPLAELHIVSFFEDRDGALWLGTYSNGLVRLRDGAAIAYGRPEGLASDEANAVLEDSTGAVWMGSRGGGLHRLQDGVLTRLGEAEGLTHDAVRALAEAPDGTLWVGTYGGAFHYDGRRFTPLGREQGLPHDTVYALLADSRGDVWFGTGAGLARLHEGTVTAYGEAQGVPQVPFSSAVEDASGVLWFGSYGGLLRYADGAFQRFTVKDGLVGDTVTSLLADAQGELWIGTSSGLSRLKDGRFWRFTREQGLYDDAVFSLLADGEGHLWLSCNRGISRVERGELEAVAEGRRAAVRPVVYDGRDGMRTAECNGGSQPSGWRGRDGRLWFTTIRGTVALEPHEVRPDPRPPEVRIEEVRVQGRPVALPPGRLELPPGSRDVEFLFTAFAPGSVEGLAFRYRLEGHDEEWVDAQGRRSVTYRSLAPGTYRFVVSAANRDGVWAEPGAAVELRLQPFFHQTVWFYALWVLGASAGVALLFRWRVGRLRARERLLQRKVEERTQALAQANEVLEENMRALRETQAQLVQAGRMAAVGTLAAGVGHEINNPLAYIVSNLEFASAELVTLARQAQDGPGQLGQRLRDMDQVLREALLGTDRVRRIVKDLKTFSRGDEETRGPVDLHAVLDSAAKMVANELRPRARLVKDYGPGACVEGNEARLAQVFLNLLINAAQALPEGHPEQHEVRLVTRVAGDKVVAEVHDTGCGISAEQQARIFDPFFTTKPVGVGTGLGLALCHAFVTSLGGTIAVQSAPGRTVFRVTLPASRAAAPGVAVAAAPPALAESAPVRGRVMVVDDDPLVGSSMRRTLAREHDVDVLMSSRQALEVLLSPEAARYDVVLCDLMMPELTGMELYAQLEADAPAVAARLVFVTGGAFTSGAQSFLDRVRNERLEKPFRPDALRELVRARVLRARSQAA
jgi:ligand-binding sensor domain-containing protein/signal transduction histidine kinase/CheY-like chemotaxis protein